MDLDRTENGFEVHQSGTGIPKLLAGIQLARKDSRTERAMAALSFAVSNVETVFCGELGGGAHGMKKRGLCGHRR
jgi:hypothetical protein